MEPTVFVFPGELISSKNSRKPYLCKSKSTGKTKVIPGKSQLAKTNESYIRDMIRKNPEFVIKWKAELLNRTYPVRLRLQIYRATHRTFDYINLIQNLFDCLVKEGLLLDDSAKYVIPVFEQYRVDKTNPRTEIIIE
jgi:Holliday junction resolvase RusA-like endonuclease